MFRPFIFALILAVIGLSSSRAAERWNPEHHPKPVVLRKQTTLSERPLEMWHPTLFKAPTRKLTAYRIEPSRRGPSFRGGHRMSLRTTSP